MEKPDHIAPRITGCLMKDGTFVSLDMSLKSRQMEEQLPENHLDDRHSLDSTDVSSQSSEEEERGEDPAGRDSEKTSLDISLSLDSHVQETPGESQKVVEPVDYVQRYSRPPGEPLKLEESWKKLEEAESLLQFSIDSVKTK
ncbi:uncharacterized protein LOC134783285 [Penaeus indicus]|uniref:uncharacterized protein LOC134783285 n=1 Tax=Penaeus indicus TaxID=29960 RepID=UPI00300D6ACC